MRWKISVLLIAAMLCVALTGIAAAEDIKCCWEKPCGTKVVQCDTETTFVLEDPGNIEIRESVHGTVYLDMFTSGDDQVSVGDIRLTAYHDYLPNTKVMPHDDDVTGEGVLFKDTIDQDILTYADLSAREDLIGKFDLYDPVYVDLDDSETVSPGDIRITDVPPKNVYNDDGDLIYAAAEFGDRWTVVKMGDPDCPINAPWPLWEIGTEVGDTQGNNGYPDDLIGYVDADCDYEWSCADKLYINQPYDEWEFDDFVTIGDTRLYIPPDDPELVCGTKVQQCEHDAVYTLNTYTYVEWGYVDVKDNNVFDGAPTKEGAYIDMDNDGVVSVGDVRLTDNSDGYTPNTKVGECNGDVGGELEVPDAFNEDGQIIFKYYDLDYYTTNDPDLRGYSLGDPIYMDMDNNSEVSTNDVRISQCPVFGGQLAAPYILAGSIGENYSRVVYQEYDELHDWELEPLPDGAGGDAEVADLIGFIDSDCSGDWTCPDKLYLQQLIGEDHDYFVTIGDFRLYIPPSAIAEGWPKCGTKVVQCNKDLVYALLDHDALGDDEYEVGYVDADDDGEYSLGEDLYLDMDSNDKVSVGDIRLCNCSTRYDPNTKVKLHEEDEGNDLESGDGDFGKVCYADINFNWEYDLEDPLYLFVDYSGWTLLDSIRLTDVPVFDNPDWGVNGSIGTAWTRVKITETDALWFDGHPVWFYELGDMEELVMVFDADCSNTWTCPDKLYLQQEWWDFVTIGDTRLYMPPLPPCDNPGDNPGHNPGDNPAMKGDFDGDGDVDFLDFTAFAGVYNTQTGGPGDFDGDGDVDFLDFTAFAGVYSP